MRFLAVLNTQAGMVNVDIEVTGNERLTLAQVKKLEAEITTEVGFKAILTNLIRLTDKEN